MQAFIKVILMKMKAWLLVYGDRVVTIMEILFSGMRGMRAMCIGKSVFSKRNQGYKNPCAVGLPRIHGTRDMNTIGKRRTFK